jgi:predicted RNA binding protein YcfA (HicA-like mRNA interferase family)
MPKLSPLSYKQLVRVFEPEGFVCVRTEGDHMVFTKRGVSRPVVVPKPVVVFKIVSVPVFVIKNNLRTAGISRDRYFELLGK